MGKGKNSGSPAAQAGLPLFVIIAIYFNVSIYLVLVKSVYFNRRPATPLFVYAITIAEIFSFAHGNTILQC